MQLLDKHTIANSSDKLSLRKSLHAYLYLAPAGVILLIFLFFPVFLSFIISFTNWEGADTPDLVHWVGIRNYSRTVHDREFWLALMNTINYVIYSVPPTLALGLGAALLVNRKFRTSGIFRTVFFLPYVTAWVSVSLVWRYFFDIETGPLNHILTHWLGLAPMRWLEEPRGIIQMFMTGVLGIKDWPNPPLVGPLLAGPSLAMVSVIITSIWRDVGFAMVIFLAGLNNIDAMHYEAARIDGAGPWQRFRHITLPLLTPVTFFLIIVGMIGAFRVFVPVLVMTPAGGPGKTTTSLMYIMYQRGFVEWKLGLGAAVAYLFFSIVFLLTLAQNRILERRVEYQQ